MSNAIELQADDFEAKVEKAEKPVLVDFYAPWCGPCKMLAPILDEVSAKYADKADFYKVNVDNAQALAGRFGIQGVPSLLFFKDGEVRDQIVGLAQADAIEQRLDALAG